MRKFLSLCLALLLIIGIVPLTGNYPTITFANSLSKKYATFIAASFRPVGYDRDGSKLVPDRYFPWEFAYGSSWGRKEVSMGVKPLYWAEFYLTIKGEAEKSRPENRWVAVIDTNGNLYFDPDGNFHNSNYDKFSDNDNPAYVAGRCAGNPRAQIDPISNTQGPYVINPGSPDYKGETYFYDKLITGRAFRIGWADLVDYPAKGSILPDGSKSTGLVNEEDWDIKLKIEKFVNDGDTVAELDEEWHLDNLLPDQYYTIGETIYRLIARVPSDPAPNTIHVGDVRLTVCSLSDGDKVYTYFPNSVVKIEDRDFGMQIVPFNDNGDPVPEVGEELHMAYPANKKFDLGEAIYIKMNGMPALYVQAGDTRLTNVNTKKVEAGPVIGGIFKGDALILSEILETNCDGSNLYDLSVETDVWLSMSPSVTSARLFSATGDVTPQSQRIQKSTVLDPDGKTFILPATTFSNIKLNYRGFLGVQIFADNGVDNNLGANLPGDMLYSQNANDDYRTARTGEEFIGSINGNYAFDYGRELTEFGTNIFFRDVGGVGFGCGEAIYKKMAFKDFALDPPTTVYYIEPGDVRMTTVTVEVNKQRYTYKATTEVNNGDLDVGMQIMKMSGHIKYYDEARKTEYVEGEPLYFSEDGIVGPGDKRLTEIVFGGRTYQCNSDLENPDFWFRENPIYMITAGLCGDGRYMDMTVMPGEMAIDVQLDKPFKVEQTTSITAKVNFPLNEGEKIHLVLKESDVPSFSGIQPPTAVYTEELVPNQWLPIVPEVEVEDTEEFLDRYNKIIVPDLIDKYGDNYMPIFLSDGKKDDTVGPKLSGFPMKPIEMTPQAEDDDPLIKYRLNPVDLNWIWPGIQYGQQSTSDPRPNYPSLGAPAYMWFSGLITPRWSDPSLAYRRSGASGSISSSGCPTTPSVSWTTADPPSGSSITQFWAVAGPNVEPWPWDFPLTPGGQFTFPFIGNSYFRIYVHTNPVVRLTNRVARHYRWDLDNVYGQTNAFPNSYVAKMIHFFDPNYPSRTGYTWASKIPMLSAYGDFYCSIAPPRYKWRHPNGSWDACTVVQVYGYETGWYSGATNFPHWGFYFPREQVITNGVWGYVDESSTPRRAVITWIVNHVYDRQTCSYNSQMTTPIENAYIPYRVQMVLYEDGTFQYNYGAGNKWYTTPNTASGWYNVNNVLTPPGPAVGYYVKQGVGAVATLLPHECNPDLGMAPSVRYSLGTVPEKVEPIEGWTSYVDYKQLDKEHTSVEFQYTPYRGTCNEDGTRTPLELMAFLDKGGVLSPVPGDPTINVAPYDKWDPPLGSPSGNNAFLYVDMDENGSITAGDIRLTNVVQATPPLNYPQGTVCKPGDADVLAPYPAFAAGWTSFDPNDIPVGGAIYDDGQELVYADMDKNGVANAGDIRLVAFDGYLQGSIVAANQWETESGKVVPYFPARSPLGVMDGKYVYWDRDWSKTITRFDVRLTAIDSYRQGSQVYAGDNDVGTPYARQNIQIGIHDPLPGSPNNDAIGYHTNVYAHLGSPYNKVVEIGDIRMSDCYTGDSSDWTIYALGSIVKDGDLDIGDAFDVYNPRIYLWDNQYITGVYADCDNSSASYTNLYMAAPNAYDIRITANLWKSFPVSNATYRPKSFEAGTLIYNPWNLDYNSSTHPYYEQLDVYGSSYYSTIFNAGLTEITNISCTAESRLYINRQVGGGSGVLPGDYRLTPIGRLFQGTVVETDSPDRQSGFLYDPFWLQHPWTKLELDENPFKAVFPIPEVRPDPLLPDNIDHRYDCYSWLKYDILPEDIVLETDKKCISLYEQRWPNVNLKLIDANNPLDVNDPSGVAISSTAKNPLMMNFNAHGGGIKFMFTSVAQPPSYQKYIGEYLEDDTVVFWYWYDNEPYGFFDTNDFLSAAYDCTRGGAFKPVGSNPTTPYYTSAPPFPGRIWDIDCSYNQTVCKICGDAPGFPKLGEVNNKYLNFAYASGDYEGHGIWNLGDRILNANGGAPAFDGQTVDPQIIRCPSQGDGGCGTVCNPRRYGTVWTYGIPIRATDWSTEDEGGRISVPIKAFNTDTPVTARVYSARTIYDNNTKIPHGPSFVLDIGPGIDYCGTIDIEVLDPDPKLNFGEFQIIDHSLQNSKVNYTTGTDALSPKAFPSPMLRADYNPILKNYRTELRSYPGGQTHTGRIPNDETMAGFNSYPAIWNDMYGKLGTEMFPLSDYGLYFTLFDGLDRKIWWDTAIRLPSRNIKQITVEGPFMRPKVYDRMGGVGTATQSYKTNYPDSLPVQYDYSGKVVIDSSNYNIYSSFSPPELTDVASPYSIDRFTYRTRNRRLLESRKLWYYGPYTRPNSSQPFTSYMVDWEYTSTLFAPVQHMVHMIDELIPIGPGKLSITVELYDGTIKKFQDCCEDIVDDIPVHGLEVNTNVSGVTVDTDTKLEVTLKEYDTRSYPPSESIIPCNDAVVLVWQDRGVRNEGGRVTGAGDGWITVPPRSSAYTSSPQQINKWFDVNNDAKISFEDYETEIIGTYDMASNTWSSGFIDGRTFQRNNGTYIFDLTKENGALVDTIGFDFGGPVTKDNLPDHVIDDYETLNVNITAFKYGDDDNDRTFAPYYSLKKPYEFSHEVYSAGHKALPVTPQLDLVVTSEPATLTAGCIPELLEGNIPLTLNVLDSNGNPLDLRKGIKDAAGDDTVKSEVIWNVLFKDPHPDNKDYFGPDAKLPTYYWVRTDLHNDDGSMINNFRMYSFPRNPFLPIGIDFTKASEGQYAFKGFCANDEGSFKIFIDTPDRKHRGIVAVNVKLPIVRYGVIDNYLASAAPSVYQNGMPVSSGIDADYVMTSCNNSLYTVVAEIKDANGNMLRGTTTSVVCNSGEELTRFTPYTTKPDNFNYYDMAALSGYVSPEIGSYVRVFQSRGNRYYSNSLLPSKKDPSTGYIIDLGGFGVYALGSWVSQWARTIGISYYNTTNWRWENGDWELYPVFDLPPAENLRGWGRGAIYNSPHKEGYLFPDWGAELIDGILDYRDSLTIPQSGQVNVSLGANDSGYYGGLIGKNPYSNTIFGDVAGGLWNYRNVASYPGDIRFRFNQYLSDTAGWTNADGTFRLDWDAFPTHDAKIGKPVAKIINETTGLDMEKNLVDPANYDLIFGKPNHITVRVSPAGSPNFAIWPDGTLVISDSGMFPDDAPVEGKAENTIFATTTITGGGTSLTVPNGTTDATLQLTPTGTWRDVAQLKYFGFRADWNGSRYIRDPIGKVWHMADFDVIRALQVTAKSGRELRAGEKNNVNVYVKEVGTEHVVSNASVKLTGAGVNLTGRTDKDGVANFEVTPKEKGEIEINVTHDSLGEGYTELIVMDAKEATELFLSIDPIVPFTRDSKVTVKGQTSRDYTLKINDIPVNIEQDGTFKTEIALLEGENIINVVAADSVGRSIKKVLSVKKDTLGPNLFIDDLPRLIDVSEYTLKGKVEEQDAVVTVNGIKAAVSNLSWQATLPLSYGKNNVLITAVDLIGNETKKEISIIVYHKIELSLAIGSKIFTINGSNAEKALDVAPYIKNAKTYVPLRVISEAFGANIQWLEDVKGIVIEFMDKKIEMQINSKRAIVNGKAVVLEDAPEITGGVTFVPLRFIADVFGAETNWNAEKKEITLTILVY